jgi:hypothetical protein
MPGRVHGEGQEREEIASLERGHAPMCDGPGWLVPARGHDRDRAPGAGEAVREQRGEALAPAVGYPATADERQLQGAVASDDRRRAPATRDSSGAGRVYPSG